MRNEIWRGLSAALSATLLNGCLVDTEKPCGDVLVERDDGACACPPGQLLSNRECIPCGKNEVVNSGECVCDSGYARPGAAQACEPMASDDSQSDAGLGSAGCVSSASCPENQLCDVANSGRCVARPQGLGSPCEDSDDCAGGAAEYCESFSSGTCQIDGCKELNGVCPGDMACCDFAILGRSLCVEGSALSDGACPAPGELVERGGSQ